MTTKSTMMMTVQNFIWVIVDIISCSGTVRTGVTSTEDAVAI